MPRLTDPDKCLHHILHPNRLDGGYTVCLMCRRVVVVTRANEVDGRTPEEQFNTMMERLNGEKMTVPRS